MLHYELGMRHFSGQTDQGLNQQKNTFPEQKVLPKDSCIPIYIYLSICLSVSLPPLYTYVYVDRRYWYVICKYMRISQMYPVCILMFIVCTYIHTYIHTLHYITLHYIALHCIALHCIALHYITLHYITLHYIHTYIHTYIYICMYACIRDGKNRLYYVDMKLYGRYDDI